MDFKISMPDQSRSLSCHMSMSWQRLLAALTLEKLEKRPKLHLHLQPARLLTLNFHLHNVTSQHLLFPASPLPLETASFQQRISCEQ